MSTITAQSEQVYSVFIRAMPEQVWDGITKPEFTAKYFYGTVIESSFEPGTSYVSRSVDGGPAMIEGEILEADPPRLLRQSWRSAWDPDQASEPASRVTWQIEAQEDGTTKLTVTHDQLESSPKTAESVSGGWSYIVSGLKTLLETGEPLASG